MLCTAGAGGEHLSSVVTAGGEQVSCAAGAGGEHFSDVATAGGEQVSCTVGAGGEHISRVDVVCRRFREVSIVRERWMMEMYSARKKATAGFTPRPCSLSCVRGFEANDRTHTRSHRWFYTQPM